MKKDFRHDSAEEDAMRGAPYAYGRIEFNLMQ